MLHGDQVDGTLYQKYRGDLLKQRAVEQPGDRSLVDVDSCVAAVEPMSKPMSHFPAPVAPLIYCKSPAYVVVLLLVGSVK